MKNTFKLSAVLLSIVAIVIMMFPGAITAAAPPTYPTSINGMPVILVKTAANDPCLKANQKIICIYDDSANIEGSLTKLDLSAYLSKNSFPRDWSIEVLGGPRTSTDDFTKSIKGLSANNTISENLSLLSGNPGYAIDQNTNSSISYQAVNWITPTVGNNQNGQNASSSLLNNAEIDGLMWDPSSGYWTHQFLQVGQSYYQINGVTHAQNEWTDRQHNLNAQPFSMPAYSGHNMKFELYYYYTDLSGSCWWIESVRDLTWGGYNYNVSWATGSTALNTINTSIFFENQNINSNWYDPHYPNGVGFTNPIQINNALTGSLGNQQYWGTEYQFIKDNNIPLSNNGSISGQLTSGQTAYFNLQYIPLQH